MVSPDDWSFPFEGPLHEVFPALHEAQNSWMSQIESLSAPDRRTHELIRLVCTVILGNPRVWNATPGWRARSVRPGMRSSGRSC
jgi:hypothetical protein